MGTSRPSAAAASVPSEARARAVLRANPDELEGWLAEQPWRALEDGSWRVEPERDGWTFRVEGVPGDAVRVVTHAPGPAPVTAWLVGS